MTEEATKTMAEEVTKSMAELTTATAAADETTTTADETIPKAEESAPKAEESAATTATEEAAPKVEEAAPEKIEADPKFVTCLEAFKACISEDAQIDTMKYTEAAKTLSLLYDALFMGVVANQLKGDIMNSAATVETAFLAAPEQDTLQKLIAAEMASVGYDKVRKNKKSATVGTLWSKRAVEFVYVYLKMLLENKGMKSGECASETYKVVLKRFHGWMISGIVGTAIGMAPSRESIFEKFGLGTDPTEVDAKLGKLTAALGTVVTELQRLLDEHNADFPDKA